MPLPVLGALVVFGIGGVVLLVHLLRMSRRTVFDDEAAVRACFDHDYPDRRISEVALADDRRAALVLTDAGPGAVTSLGDGAVTRLFSPGDVRKVEERESGLRLALADFGAPTLSFSCADGARRARVKRMLETVQ